MSCASTNEPTLTKSMWLYLSASSFFYSSVSELIGTSLGVSSVNIGSSGISVFPLAISNYGGSGISY